jgi:hypothetical protein
VERLGAVLTSSHLRELGCTRTHIDAIWRACPMIILPGTRRPVLRVEDYLAYLEEHTYRNDQPRVRSPFGPLAGASPTELANQRRGHEGRGQRPTGRWHKRRHSSRRPLSALATGLATPWLPTQSDSVR